MSRGTLLARVGGLVLIALVLWAVGWRDRVRTQDGDEEVGRVVEQGDDYAVVERDGVRTRVEIRDARDVREGLGSAFGRLARRPGLALAGLLAHLAAMAVTIVRWGALLRGAELRLGAGEVARLGWVGNFFGSVLPGGTAAGDVVKAVYVARRHGGRRTRAVVTVFFDRLVGLSVLCAIAVVVVFFAPAVPGTETARALVLAVFGLFLVAAILFWSEPTRRALRLPALLARLPLQGVVTEVRHALAVYGRLPQTVGLALALSLLGHAGFLTAFGFYGAALGDPLPLLAVAVAVPVAQMLAAIPGLPGGWGVGDFAFFAFLPAAGVPPAQAVALSFTFRIGHTLLSLPGGLLLASQR